MLPVKSIITYLLAAGIIACGAERDILDPEFYEVNAQVFVRSTEGITQNWAGSFVYSKLVPQDTVSPQNPDDATNGFAGYRAWQNRTDDIAYNIISAGQPLSGDITTYIKFKNVPPGNYELHAFTDLASNRVHRKHDPLSWAGKNAEKACYSHSQATIFSISTDGAATAILTSSPANFTTFASNLHVYSIGSATMTAIDSLASLDTQRVTLFGSKRIAGSTYYVVGEGARIYKSADSGTSWMNQGFDTTIVAGSVVQGASHFRKEGSPIDFSRSLYAVDCRDATNCIAVGYYGSIVTTQDGGVTWNTYDSQCTAIGCVGWFSTGVTDQLTSVSYTAAGACPFPGAPGTECAIVVGENGVILMIAFDAGFNILEIRKTFAFENNETTGLVDTTAVISTGYNAVYAISNTNIWIVGAYTDIRSRATVVNYDTGTGFWRGPGITVTGLPQRSFYAMAYDGSNIWAVGEDHQYFHTTAVSPPVYTTNWISPAGTAASDPQSLFAISTPSSTNIFTAGTRGILNRSTNGGTTAPAFLADLRSTTFIMPTETHVDDDGVVVAGCITLDTITDDGVCQCHKKLVSPHSDHDTATDGFCNRHTVAVSAAHPIDHDLGNIPNDGFCFQHSGIESQKLADAFNTIGFSPDSADPKYSIRNIVVSQANQTALKNISLFPGRKTNSNFWPTDDANWASESKDANDDGDGWNEWY